MNVLQWARQLLNPKGVGESDEAAADGEAHPLVLTAFADDVLDLERGVAEKAWGRETYALPEVAWPPLPAARAMRAGLEEVAAAAPGLVHGHATEALAATLSAMAKRAQAAAAGVMALEQERIPGVAGQAEGFCEQVHAIVARVEQLRAAVAQSLLRLGGEPARPSAPRPPAAAEGSALFALAGRLTGEVGALATEAEALAADLDALRVVAAERERELEGLVDLLGEAAHAISIRGVRPVWEKLGAMTGALEACWAGLEQETPGDEAVGHYHGIVTQRMAEFRRRLDAVDGELNEGGPSVARQVDLETRIEALEARCARLRNAWYTDNEAAPMVQQYLRPILDDLIRDVLAPLLEEADGSDEGHPLRRAVAETSRVLKESIDFEIIHPPAGAPLDEATQEEIEVRPAASAAERDTVAETSRAGYRWSGEVIAKARVVSRR